MDTKLECRLGFKESADSLADHVGFGHTPAVLTFPEDSEAADAVMVRVCHADVEDFC
jgi:phosphatidylserine synthase